ncbi:MAG: cytochrome c [Deltaproteobacteria bacterium]|nr:cytochrome c [Deltaproteobacteria bacterium]
MRANRSLIRFGVLFVIVTVAAALFAVNSAPAAGVLGDAAKGAAPYKTYCMSCHGEKGDGAGPAAAALNPKPRNFTDKAFMATLTDDYIVKVITEGGQAVGKSPLMVAWKAVLKPEEIKDVAAYVRSLAK